VSEFLSYNGEWTSVTLSYGAGNEQRRLLVRVRAQHSPHLVRPAGRQLHAAIIARPPALRNEWRDRETPPSFGIIGLVGGAQPLVARCRLGDC